MSCGLKFGAIPIEKTTGEDFLSLLNKIEEIHQGMRLIIQNTGDLMKEAYIVIAEGVYW